MCILPFPLAKIHFTAVSTGFIHRRWHSRDFSLHTVYNNYHISFKVRQEDLVFIIIVYSCSEPYSFSKLLPSVSIIKKIHFPCFRPWMERKRKTLPCMGFFGSLYLCQFTPSEARQQHGWYGKLAHPSQETWSPSTFQALALSGKRFSAQIWHIKMFIKLNYIFFLSYQKVHQMILPHVCWLLLIFGVVIFKPKGLGEKTAVPFLNH